MKKSLFLLVGKVCDWLRYDEFSPQEIQGMAELEYEFPNIFADTQIVSI
jgi:hypothetical protein